MIETNKVHKHCHSKNNKSHTTEENHSSSYYVRQFLSIETFKKKKQNKTKEAITFFAGVANNFFMKLNQIN